MMFLVRRPSVEAIAGFLHQSEKASLSYGQPGILRSPSAAHGIREWTYAVGRGNADFERARNALAEWKHFALGWVELYPRRAPISTGTVVAVLIRHFGFWSLNGCRVVDVTGSENARFGFVYGTLTNHVESGEELFEVFLDPGTNTVIYRIRATSRAQAALARIGRPVVRVLQTRFRNDSADAMRRAIHSQEVRP